MSLLKLFPIFKICLFVFALSCSNTEKNQFKAPEVESHGFESFNVTRPIYNLILENKLDVALGSIESKLVSKETQKNEKAELYYLRALVFNRLNKYQLSNTDLDSALKIAPSNKFKSLIQHLWAQNYLALNEIDKSKQALSLVQPEDLPEKDFYDYFLSLYQVNEKLSLQDESFRALGSYLGQFKSLSSLKSSNLFNIYLGLFEKYDQTQKIEILKKRQAHQAFPLGVLAYLEALKVHSIQGLKQAYENPFVDILKYEYSEFEELMELTEVFYDRAERNISDQGHSIDGSVIKIGVVFPLSGKLAKFGSFVLNGLFEGLYLNGEMQKNFHFEVRDSQGNGDKGALLLRDLVQKEKVQLVIGGLFPKEALEQFSMAKKLGIPFISLSNVYVPSTEKNRFLFEIEPSVESQIAFLRNSTEKLGEKLALLYSHDLMGETYLNQFWESQGNLKVKKVFSYNRQDEDYREVIASLLALNLRRERQEEYDILKSTYAKMKNAQARGTQVLTPLVDFDWVYIAGLPSEAVKIIPAFNYYDTKHIKFIGGPSWDDQWLQKSIGKRNTFYIATNKEALHNMLTNLGRPTPSLLEMKGLEAFYLTLELGKKAIREKSFEFLKNENIIKSDYTSWDYVKSSWQKSNLILAN